MKKIFYVIGLFMTVLFNVKVVYANDIKSITMDIYVDGEGDAHVTETWYVSLTSGTEGYKPYYDLGNSTIEDFKVSLNGDYFTTIDNWDTSASFTDKSYKAGINYTSDGLELCFGISSYGLNTYVMEYTITSFVSTVADADMIYWQLIPYELSNKPEYVYIKIYSDFAYDDDLDVWGYGNYGGYAYVYDGYIELISEDGLDNDEYMVVLAKFPKGTFNTTSVLDEDFDYYLEMAEEGATSYSESSSFWVEFMSILTVLLAYGIIFAIVFLCVKNTNNNNGTKKLKFGKGEKNIKDAPYFRDIPCNKDIFKAYWVACQYNLIKKNTDFLGAILLKWLKDGNIENVVVNEKKDKKGLKLVSTDNLNELEIELYEMIKTASKDGILESNEFKNYCSNHYNKVLKWFNKVIDYVTDEYVQEGLITENQKTFGKEYVVNPMMKEHAMQMAGLKKFLKDFSNIKDRESIEVKLWEYYLIYAQIFGIAEEVAKEFKKLYPDVITDDYYNDIVFIRVMSFQAVNAASVARTRAQSYSGGGGGFSSGGGGGGSFGGGGGGGGFR